ncbi:MAG: PstS family phosphate ABC transporter substrate-binding protein [Acidimicrobiales bacterium]
MRSPFGCLGRHARLRALGAGVALVMAAAAPAAAQPTGFNNTVDQVRIVGSDTTYFAIQRLIDLYQPSPGCTLASATGFTTCSSNGTITSENHDHDELSQGFIIGSSNGIRILCGTVGPGPLPIDVARSSRNKGASDCSGLTFQAFARDGQVPLFFPTIGTRPAQNARRNLTRTELQGIFVNCSINNWSQLGGANEPIVPFGVQTGAGTYQSWFDFLGGDPNSCAGGTGTVNRAPFIVQENDAGPIAAMGSTVHGRAITWFSYGRFITFPFSAQQGQVTTVGGIAASPTSIARAPGTTGAYPAARFLWNVYKTATAKQAATTFLDWSCKTTHVVNPFSGKNYNTEISNSINNGSGFVRLTGANCVKDLT